MATRSAAPASAIGRTSVASSCTTVRTTVGAGGGAVGAVALVETDARGPAPSDIGLANAAVGSAAVASTSAASAAEARRVMGRVAVIGGLLGGKGWNRWGARYGRRRAASTNSATPGM